MTTQLTDQDLHPAFIDGSDKKLLIGGEWKPAISGKTIPSVNPSTGEPIARIADGGELLESFFGRGVRQLEDGVELARVLIERNARNFAPAQDARL